MSREKFMTMQTRDGFPRVSGDEPSQTSSA